MVMRKKVLENVLFVLLCIYIARVVIVLVYLDAKYLPIPGGPHAPGQLDPRLESKGISRGDLRQILEDVAESKAAEKEREKETEEEEKRAIENENEEKEMRNREEELAEQHQNDEQKEDEEELDLTWMQDEVNILDIGNLVNGMYFARVLKQNFDHSESCRMSSPFLVALIDSPAENFEFRLAIRETWGNVPDLEHLGVVVMFVLGLPRENKESQQLSIVQENDRHDDILQGNFIDTTRNLTLKSLVGTRFATRHCQSAKFIFHGDDHMLVNFERLVRHLRNLNQAEFKKMWRGRIINHSKPDRNKNSRYFVPQELFKGAVYPPFCTADAGCVMSMDVGSEILRSSWTQPLLPFPDVYGGIIGKDKGWKLVSDDSFSYRDFKNDVCALRSVVTSRGFNNPDLFTSSWSKLNNRTFLRECPEPDLDLVLSGTDSNKEYLDKTLKLIHDHPSSCFDADHKEEDVFLVVLISSLPRNFDARRAIRDTWGGVKTVLDESIRLLFVMGLTQRDTEEVQKKVQVEDDQYGDIIQADFRESFQNLTLKVVLGLKWITQNCAHSKYMYKGDDDMFVNWENIVSYLHDLQKKGEAKTKFFAGSVLYRSVRITRKDSKYYVPDKVYSGRYFPPYCSGGGYIISTNIIPAMYEKSLTTAFIPIDDAYQGILAKKIGVTPRNNKGFKNWGQKSDTCSLRNKELMTIHGYKDPIKMYEVWRNYTDETVNCNDQR